MITLQAKNTIISSTGSHKPGEVFKCDEKEAAFLIKKGAAVETRTKATPKMEDSPEKETVVNSAAKEKNSAEKKAAKSKKKSDKANRKNK